MKKINNFNPKNLKLKDVIRLLDPLVYCVVWAEEDREKDEEPDYKGLLFDLPWFYLDYILGAEDENGENPISFRENLGKDCDNRPGVVITLTPPEYLRGK